MFSLDFGPEQHVLRGECQLSPTCPEPELRAAGWIWMDFFQLLPPSLPSLFFISPELTASSLRSLSLVIGAMDALGFRKTGSHERYIFLDRAWKRVKVKDAERNTL